MPRFNFSMSNRPILTKMKRAAIKYVQMQVQPPSHLFAAKLGNQMKVAITDLAPNHAKKSLKVWFAFVSFIFILNFMRIRITLEAKDLWLSFQKGILNLEMR